MLGFSISFAIFTGFTSSFWLDCVYYDFTRTAVRAYLLYWCFFAFKLNLFDWIYTDKISRFLHDTFYIDLDSLPQFRENVTGCSQYIGIYHSYFRIRKQDPKTAINICFEYAD